MTDSIIIPPKFNRLIPVTKNQFQSFREQLYQCFEYRADSAMDLLDELSSNVMLAYTQLWAAHWLAVALPKPWESVNHTHPSVRIRPSMVQRNWNRIISQVGTSLSLD